MKTTNSPNGRRHGLRARCAIAGRPARTVLTIERRAQVYRWTTDRGRGRAVAAR